MYSAGLEGDIRDGVHEWNVDLDGFGDKVLDFTK